MLYEPGILYAAYSRYCDWVKIGFTSRSAGERLVECADRYFGFGPFSLIGSVKSTWSAEQQIHRILAPLRQRRTALTGELYPAVPSIVSFVGALLKNKDWEPLPWEQSREVRAWARRVASHPKNESEALKAFGVFRTQQGTTPFMKPADRLAAFHAGLARHRQATA